MSKKFAFLCDLHYGFERKHGHKIALHDQKAFDSTLKFLQDFKPDTIIVGGDFLDCGPVSHHTKGQPGKTEGLRLLSDAQECRANAIKPLEDLQASTYVYITGNHERFLTDLTDVQPELEGIVDLRTLLELDERWQIVPQGGYHHMGKLVFCHGDQLSGGDHIAKAAVVSAEKSIRFGHTHQFQAYSKVSSLDIKYPRTGIAVPCLCRRDPSYGKGRPNRWTQGFLWGYSQPDGSYSDYVSVIINGQFTANGKNYRG